MDSAPAASSWPSAMQSIKSAIGIGPKADETEPVSGETGAGTAAEPYDAGNAEGEYIAS